ncbi:S-adenosyl-L-methionine-dependent tRNA 4-demethylwyosine synthase TYW1-like [Brevipalpus obovatus]|uniref:S-adenosyl-L-methionine-dependent tRNA 4-demethylwyosine synthase TYW1-like n=1 Tax=Brevipalpus obovatus TaxID=246614 RepID=UPI003D9E9C9B
MPSSLIRELISHKYFIPIVVTTVAVTYSLLNRKRLKALKSNESKTPVNGEKCEEPSSCCCSNDSSVYCNDFNKFDDDRKNFLIFFGSQTGTAKSLAQKLCAHLRDCEDAAKIQAFLFECNQIEKILDNPKFSDHDSIIIIILSTYTDGKPPENAQNFFDALGNPSHLLTGIISKFPILLFGLGNSQYADNFCKASKDLENILTSNDAKFLIESHLFDEDGGTELEQVFDDWIKAFLPKALGQDAPQCCNDKPVEEAYSDSEDEQTNKDPGDIEDLIPSEKKKVNGIKEMVSPIIHKNLTKQGYKIVGTHSAVKMCRWTKSMLRGRGGCYKHTFYGIESHRCMESTPSLACANKCVFCWRHHTNPVGTEWNWAQEEPEFILNGFLENHQKMIKEFKGVPGVKSGRYKEAMTVKHCALSLVGEPIFYPKINEFLRLLHEKNISSFLVTNAQFPEAIKTLEPVTQLYVSVDAATEDALKKIDRPLFKDAFDRLLSSLRLLRSVKGRTVYRLTLVKEWNNEEMESYASLVKEGDPDFIEVKGVTYFGDSKDSKLTMQNVPWHEEVLKFSSMLAELIAPRWELMAEHEHSNAILIAKTDFKVDGKWMTWIDYEKFHQLFNRYLENGETFSSLDYAKETPKWALFGSKDRGFDPKEKRFRRKNRK